MDGIYDATIAVIADEAVRAQRAAARGHVGVDERAARQLPQEEKARRATYTVANSGTSSSSSASCPTYSRAYEPDERPPDHHAAAAPRAPLARRVSPRAGGAGAATLARRRAARRAGRGASSLPRLPDAVREIALPLRHEDIIRQQAAAKELDPSLLAAVIYAESRFRDADLARRRAGLMQITPETAKLHRPPVGRHGVRAGRPRHAADQHRLRRLLPALPAAPLRRQHGAGARRLQRRRGQRRPLDRRDAASASAASASSRSRSPRRASTSAACSTRAAATARSTAASSACSSRGGAGAPGARAPDARLTVRTRG